jgi:hypothetical protein
MSNPPTAYLARDEVGKGVSLVRGTEALQSLRGWKVISAGASTPTFSTSEIVVEGKGNGGKEPPLRPAVMFDVAGNRRLQPLGLLTNQKGPISHYRINDDLPAGEFDRALYVDFAQRGCTDVILPGHGIFLGVPSNDPSCSYRKNAPTPLDEGTAVLSDFLGKPGKPVPSLFHVSKNGESRLWTWDKKKQSLRDEDLAATFPGFEPPSGGLVEIQAVDVDGDGKVDLYVGGRVFLNGSPDNHVLRGIAESDPVRFLDRNGDGCPDAVVLDRAACVLRIFDGPDFEHETRVSVGAGESSCNSMTLATIDADMDGREDVVLGAPGAGNAGMVRLFLLKDSVTKEVRQKWPVTGRIHSMATGDLDPNRDGAPDLLVAMNRGLAVLQNETPGFSFLVEPVFVDPDDAGAVTATPHQGRLMRATPQCRPEVIMTRVIDGGSNSRSQGSYATRFGTLYPCPHDVELILPEGRLTAVVEPGGKVRIGNKEPCDCGKYLAPTPSP